MKEQNKKNIKLKTNSKIMKVTLLLAFLVILYIIRLFQLQILDVYEYKYKGNKISKIGTEIKPERGNIYDRNNKPLAITQDHESLYLLPVTTEERSNKAENIRNNEEEFNKLNEDEKEKYIRLSSIPTYKDVDIEKVANILNISKDNIYELIDKEQEGFIYRSVSKVQKSQLEKLDLKYLRFISVKDRYYPNNDVLASTVGFVDKEGIANNGLELYYDDILSGKSGYKEYFKALQGTEIPYTKNKNINPEEGKNIVTTLDIELQNIISKRMKETFYKYKPMSGVAVLTNPNDGSILALESLPNFDANNPRSLASEIDKLFINNLEQAEISEYLLSRWSNKAVSMQYDPGSVYKIITSAIVLEADNELKNKIYEDKGYIELADDVIIRSWRFWNPHGPQNLKDALKNSSNPVFVQLARDIGKKRYIDYAKVYNLGHKSGVDMPGEVSGFFPKNENISDVNFGTMSYGHYVNVNAVQFISALNSTVNGGKYYKPHLLKEIVNKDGEVVYKENSSYLGKTVSENTSTEMREYLKYVADNYGLNDDESIKFGAKTGSTVKYKVNSIFNENKDDESLILSIYVTYPADNPKYSLLIYFDEPQGVSTSAQINVDLAHNIMRDIIELESENGNPRQDIAEYIEIPDFINLTVEKANSIAYDNNLQLSTNADIGRYHIITEQYPEAGNLIKRNSNIKINSDGKIKMPRVIGREVKEIKELFDINHVSYKIEGNGDIVIDQSIKEDTIFKDEEIIISTEEKR